MNEQKTTRQQHFYGTFSMSPIKETENFAQHMPLKRKIFLKKRKIYPD